MRDTSRRRFLSTVGLSALGAAAGLAPVTARALSVEPFEGAVYESYIGACGQDPTHQGFVDEVMALLNQYGATADKTQVEAALAATTCPYCRCPLNQTAQ